MPLINLYFSPALLLLVLTCPPWQLGQAAPVTTTVPMTDSCVLQARTLLQNITVTLAQTNLFSGIDCTKQSVELNMKTKTASVCSPKESTCSGIVKSEFDQESCLSDIKEDLRHYYKFLAAQPDPGRIGAVLSSLRELIEGCFECSLPTDVQAAADRPSTYDERLSLCKVLRGFQVRTISINRAIAYMNSDEHTN